MTLWTVVCQAPLSMGFSRQEYWSRWPFLSPGDLTDSGIELTYPALAGVFFITELPGNCKIYLKICKHHLFEITLMSVVYAICFLGDPSGYWGSSCCVVYIPLLNSAQQWTAITMYGNVYYTCIQYSIVALPQSVNQHAFGNWLRFT